MSEDPDDKEKRRLKYLDQEKFDYIQNYLEQSREQTKDVDSQSVTTETSDSGMLGSHSAHLKVLKTPAVSYQQKIHSYRLRSKSTNRAVSKFFVHEGPTYAPSL